MTVEKKSSKGLLLPRAHEMQLRRWHGRLFVFKRLLLFVVILASLILVVTFYSTIEGSYLDLVDSLLLDSSTFTADAAGDVIPADLYPCSDGSGWVEEWISSGVMPKCSLAHRGKVDVVYTYVSFLTRINQRWVNGSEALYQREKTRWQESSPVFGGSGLMHDRKLRATERRHREHDELRYSIRSIFKYLNNSVSKILILASDFFDPNTNSWIGQTPSWLDFEAAERHGVSMLYTSELYGERNSSLPIFSSLALESQLYNLPSTGNDVIVYLNDDMFIASEHSVSDFWNPLIGITIQVDPLIFVENKNSSVAEFQTDWSSEWTALRYSNFLLSMLRLDHTDSR